MFHKPIKSDSSSAARDQTTTTTSRPTKKSTQLTKIMVTRLRVHLADMGCSLPENEEEDFNPKVCSGRGECGPNNSCICEIRYTGEHCLDYNKSYHAGVSAIFYVVAFVSLVQLLICCFASYKKLKNPSFLKACRVTTQKFLYFVVFLASLLRAAYFTQPESVQPSWAYYLMSAYYPLLMTCASLVVCFWAETFHLRDIRWERQFLSKSFLGFLAFNLLPYSLFGAEILSAKFFSNKNTLHSIFNGGYAVLLLIVVVFFLIYGVEVFFKIRGGFVYDFNVAPSINGDNINVNASQVHQSRIGLLSQAIMLIVIVGFLTSETLGDFWKQKVPVNSRNLYDIGFRIVEVGVFVWFLACLWNSFSPEQLWILNPRKLLTRQIDPVASSSKTSDENQTLLVCWVCYDQDKQEPLIQPCRCTGDVSSVHHECLRRWLVESYKEEETADLKCRVCSTPYEIRRTSKLYWEKGFDIHHWTKTIILVSLMCITGVLAWVIIQLYVDPFIRVLTAGFAIIIGYVCVKLLGKNTVTAYQRAKVSSIDIVSNNDLRVSRNLIQARLNSISEDIEIDRR